MGRGTDRRAWLILSQREAVALENVAVEWLLERGQLATGDLERALRMIDEQVRWINGALDGEEPRPSAAVARDNNTPD